MVVRPAVPSLAHGLQDARALGLPESPMHLQAHKPKPPVEDPTPARAGGRARSPRSPIASGAAETITLRWYAPCSFNDAPPPGGASKCREEP
jgi:hypothetical protein